MKATTLPPLPSRAVSPFPVLHLVLGFLFQASKILHQLLFDAFSIRR